MRTERKQKRSHGTWRCLAVLVSAIVRLTIPVDWISIGPQVAWADQAADDYAAAVGFYKQSRWGLAEESFKKFLKDHAKHDRVSFARLYLGLSLTNLEKYDEARTTLRGFVKDFPNNAQVPQAMYRVAESSYFLDDLKGAEAEFTAFLVKSPEDSLREYALPYLADTQLRLGKPDAAAENFQQSIKLFPQGKVLEDSRWGLAKALEAQQKFPEALVLYREVAANRAGLRAAQAQLQIASRLFEQKDFANAAKAYTDLEKNFPESKHVATARLNAGYAFYELKDFKAAATQFELAAKEPDQAPAASYWRGMSQKQTGDLAGAATVLKAAFEAHSANPIAEQVLFQWADCELRLSQFDSAELHFADVAKRWPQGQWADDALYFAGEAALQRANRDPNAETRTAAIQAAESYTKQFATTQPNSGLKLYNELLRGRVLLARGSDADATASVDLFKGVIAAAQRPQTQLQARYHLARAQQRLKQHAAVIETLGPVVEQVRKEGAVSEFIDALVMFASSALAEKKYPEAIAAAADDIRLAPKSEQLDQALVTKALAEANLKQLDAAKQSLAQLKASVPNSPLIVRTALQLAEVAYSQKQFDASLEWYAAAVAAGPQSPHFVAALSGQAWSQFEKKQYKPAAEGFAKLVKDFPQNGLAAEAAFKLGESLQLDNQLDAAAKAFAEAFESYSPGRYGYLAGLEGARTLRRANKPAEADAAYEKLLVKFPKPENLDKLFDEWALLNYEAGRFARSDEIFKRLIAEMPNSDLADNARFSLAESDLLSSVNPDDGSVNTAKVDAAKAAFQKLEQDPKSDAEVQELSLWRLMQVAEQQKQWDEMTKVATAHRTRFAEGEHKLDAAFHLALAQVQRQQIEPAFELLKPLAAMKGDPKTKEMDWFPRVFVLLAEIQWKQKNYADAVATVTDFRAWDSKNRLQYQADEVLGRAYKNQAKFDEARAAFQKAIDDPNGKRTETAAKAQFMIAESFMLQQNYKSALESFLKVDILYEFPEWQAPALFQAAGCDEKLGDWPQVVRDYDALITKFPKSEWAEMAKPLLAKAKLEAAKAKK